MPRTKRAKEAVAPRKRLVQQRSLSTVEVILEAAAQVLEREGYTVTTTDLIAERAGVSIGTLYQYFPNKDAILLALTQQHARAAQAALEPLLREVVDSTPPVESWVARFVRACVALNGHRPRLHQILFEETPCVSISGEVIYTLRDTPPLHLPFTELAEYREGEIVRLADSASPASVAELSGWMAHYGARLLP